jgi:hypothetical protein
LRLVGNLEALEQRLLVGWSAEAWQAAQIGEAPTASLGRFLLGQPPTRPINPVTFDPSWNQQVRDWFLDDRRVVVTEDVTEYLDPEGHPTSNVVAIVTPEELFQ